MYLYGRLVGVGTYSITLLIICLLILIMPRKKVGSILFLYTIALSIMGFLYVPASGADLYRIIDYMHQYASLSFEKIIELVKDN